MRLRFAEAARLSFIAILAATLAWSGCKKEDPAPAGGAATESSGGAATAEGAATGAGAEAAGTKVGDEAPNADSPKVDSDRPAGSAAPAATAVAVVEAPASVVLYGGMASLNSVVETASGMADDVAQGALVAGLDKQVTEGLKEMLNVSNLDWLARDKAIKVVVLDPKTVDNGALVLMPTTGKDAFVAALPADHKKGEAGNEFTYQGGLQTYHVNFAGNYAVFSNAAPAYEAAKSFIEGPLNAYSPRLPFELTIEVANLMRIFQAEVAAGRQEITRELTRMPGAEDMAGTLEKEIQFFFDLAESVDALDLTVRKDGVHAILGMGLRPLADTKMKPFYTAGKGRSIGLLDFIPENSYFVLSGNSDPAAGMDLLQAMGEDFIKTTLKEALGFSDEETTRFMAIQKRAMTLGTGESMFAVHPEGKAALAFSGMAKVTDGTSARQVMNDMMGLMWPKLVELMKKESGGEIPPALDLTTFTTTINSMGALVAELGVKLAVKEETRGDAVFDVLAVDVDWSKVPDAESSDVADLRAITGDKLELVIGYGKNAYAFAIGAEALARAQGMLEGKRAPKPKGLEEAMRIGTPGSSTVLYLSVLDGMKAFSGLSELEPVRSDLRGAAVDNGVAFTMGTGANDSLQITVDVPLDHVKKLVEIFNRL